MPTIPLVLPRRQGVPRLCPTGVTLYAKPVPPYRHGPPRPCLSGRTRHYLPYLTLRFQAIVRSPQTVCDVDAHDCGRLWRAGAGRGTLRHAPASGAFWASSSNGPPKMPSSTEPATVMTRVTTHAGGVKGRGASAPPGRMYM